MTGAKAFSIPPATVSEFLERLDALTDTLPKRLRQCATFTRRHLHLIAVSTVSDIAAASEVAPSVYMRFCQTLGFSGYSEMQALFRARYTDFRPDYRERLATLSDESGADVGQLMAEFAEAGHRSLISIANSVTRESMETVAHGMARAEVIHLVGLRRAFPVVSSMAYLLDKMGVPASLHTGAGLLETGGAIRDGDALFAVTFAPFSDETIALATGAAERGIPVFGLTDSSRCPIAGVADALLIARETEVAGFRSLTAALTLATTLAVAVGALQRGR